MKYYSLSKKNELSCHEKTRWILTFIFLSEISQSEKVTYYVFLTYNILEKAKLWKKEKYQWFPGVVEKAGMNR